MSLEFEASTEKSIKKIQEFKDLERNWDSYNARPISEIAIAKSVGFINSLALVAPESERFTPFSIVPLADGGIQFNFMGKDKYQTREELDLEVTTDGRLEYQTVFVHQNSIFDLSEDVKDASDIQVITEILRINA